MRAPDRGELVRALHLVSAILLLASCKKAEPTATPTPKPTREPGVPVDLSELYEYSGMTTDELLALENEYEPYILIWQFEYGVEEKIEQEGQDALTEEEMNVLAVQALDREVNNGGYHQFFTNSSVEYAPIIVDALHRIGCTRVAELTQEAIDILEIDGPLTVKAIEQVIHGERSVESIGDCSYELIAFIRENRDRITVGE